MAAKSKIVFEATPQDVFAVLTDFESYPEFIPEIGSATIEEEGVGYTVVSFTLHAGKTIHYTLRFEPKPYDSIRWSYVRGDLRSNTGSWTLTPKGDTTVGHYEVAIDLGRMVPKFLMSAAAGVGLPNILKRFKNRVESGESKRVISLDEQLAQYEKQLIQRYLRRAQWDTPAAARQLSLSEQELKKRILAHGLSINRTA